MGNLVSCSNLPAPLMKAAKAARVILPSGEVRQFRQPVKAAELMLESPNSFLVNSSSLKMGRRFSALSADEDLEFGNVYIMFPMRRVNSVVTAADMAVVLMAANTASRRIAGGKVKPEVVVALAPAAAAAEEEAEDGGDRNNNERSRLNSGHEIEGFQDMEYRFRLSSCKSRKPLLDTITEEPIFSR
ncbi:OLC1v1032141C1 [Oldenlandia corymbosa var. corymbosa]|uniref:OLC1v1032141C1 n=1 Tax=Oldenlandia corymbosa var. corymbosa TaxID=529605 RepID=A0AAV1CNG7_OLDCO|nr:OLC1v1032141C1 [Oldenlandia corymbosa var. corymbosa]